MSDPFDPTPLTIDVIASLDAEHGVIGALLLDNSAFDRVGNVLKSEYFYGSVNRRVYAEIERQIMACKSCDVVTVGVALDGIVEMSELHEMAQFVPSAANVVRYAATIVERFKSRALLAVSSNITELAQDHARSIEDRVDLAQAQLVKLIDGSPKDDWLSMDDSLAQAMDALTDRESGESSAMATGLADLDRYLEGGPRPGELIIVGARPSMGKTALAMTIGLNMAADYSVAMLSMEMSHSDVQDRMVAMLGQLSLSGVKRPKFGGGLQWDRVTDAVEKGRLLNFYVSDQSGLNINQVRSKARNMKRLNGLNVLIVDYIGLMSGLDSKQQRAYQLEEISRGLKTLAKELDIAVICLAQVNRKVEERTDQTPNLSDLRDSGAIEQDADVVVFVHRPIQSRPDMGEEWARYAKVSVAKNRNGRCGNLSLSYVGEQTRFDAWHGETPTRKTAFGSRDKDL